MSEKIVKRLFYLIILIVLLIEFFSPFAYSTSSEENQTENSTTTEENTTVTEEIIEDTEESTEETEDVLTVEEIVEDTPTVLSAGTVGKVTASTYFSKDYGWSFKFISGVTTITTNGMTNYEADQYFYTSAKGVFTRSNSSYYSVRLTSAKKTEAQAGNIWVRYNNVGTYNGEIIDLKILLSGWSYLQPANTSASDNLQGVSYPAVYFPKNKIGVEMTSQPSIDSPIFTFQFFKHETDTQISVMCHENFIDIDNGEYFIPTSGFDEIYILSDSNLTATTSKVSSTYGTTSSSTAKENWATVLLSGTEIKFIYTAIHHTKGNSYRDITQTASSTTRAVYSFYVNEQSLAPFEITSPTKTVSSEEVYNEDEFYYMIQHYIPGEGSSYYYDSYTISDILAPCLEITGDITITDDSGGDKNSLFTITTEDTTANWLNYNLPEVSTETGKTKKKITITASSETLASSSFYNNNYYFKIPVRKIENYDMTVYYSAQSLGNSKITKVPNTGKFNITRSNSGYTGANSIISSNNNSTNTVNVNMYAKINTEVQNGTIDESNLKVPLGSTQTINYEPNEGYLLESVTVNGENVDIENYTNSYTITNITKNTDIKVVYTEPDVTGSITINKQGVNNTPLEGVELELYNTSSGELIDTKQTDSEGKITFENLDLGQYHVIETKTLADYELYGETINIELTNDNTDVELTIKNKQKLILPEAGGTGSNLSVVIGFGLMILAFIIMIKTNLNVKEDKNTRKNKKYN